MDCSAEASPYIRCSLSLLGNVLLYEWHATDLICPAHKETILEMEPFNFKLILLKLLLLFYLYFIQIQSKGSSATNSEKKC